MLETRTHCPYCAFQCGIRITGSAKAPVVSGDPDFPVNRGRLCAKGFTAAATLSHPERLTTPLARDVSGNLVPVSWNAALDRVEAGIRAVQEAYGADAVGVFGSGALTNEKTYLLGKFARVALRTASIDYNGRFCMSSAAAASNRAFGIDRGLPFPIADLARADVVLIAGGNPAETMPPLMQYIDELRARGGKLIVVDPRRTATAESASHHLAVTPGTDAVLALGLIHLLIRERLADADYIARRTEGFDRIRTLVAAYWPGRVERITGIPEATLLEVATILGRAGSVTVLTGRGPEQQAQGVNNASAYLNLALVLGAPGKPSSGYGCLTGQGNGQGGREHGQKADQLPGYRDIRDPAARRHMAEVWNVTEESIPTAGLSAQEMLEKLGQDDGVRALLVFGSNPVVSAADALTIDRGLRSLHLLVVSDFFLSETARLADVVLPSAQWAEEEGTMTNLEGRVIHRRQAFTPPDGVKTDLEILSLIAERLGHKERFTYGSPAEVFDELRRATAGSRADYSGITYDRLDRENGVHWPCPSQIHPGTPVMFAERFNTPDGRARFLGDPHLPAAEEPDEDFPLYLTTGRLLAHYQTGTQTRRVPQLDRMAPRPTAQMHPLTARRFGVADGADLVLTTRRGSAHFRAEVTPRLRQDTVFVPFHWGGAESANRLTNAALDPISRMPEFKVCAVRIESTTESGGLT